MILVRGISGREREIDLVHWQGRRADDGVRLPAILDAAHALGLRLARLQEAAGGIRVIQVQSRSDTSPAPNAAATNDADALDIDASTWTLGDGRLEELLLEHRWQVDDHCLVYDARFAHDEASLPCVALYASLLVATVGADESDMLQTRLAVYELCANTLEHGVVRTQPAEIGIHLALTPGAVHGWIQDGCERFDPTAQPVGSVRQRAAERATRGYGIHMLHQLLDNLQHEFNATGNRVHFSKRMAT